MQQFGVYRNRNKATRSAYPLLLNVQSDLISDTGTRVVVPLVEDGRGIPAMPPLAEAPAPVQQTQPHNQAQAGHQVSPQQVAALAPANGRTSSSRGIEMLHGVVMDVTQLNEARRSDESRAVPGGPRARLALAEAPARATRIVDRPVDEQRVTAIQTLLHRHSGQDDILVSAPVAGRRAVETEELINRLRNEVIPAAVGDASETSRTKPNPAMKLNQFPSSEMNCP